MNDRAVIGDSPRRREDARFVTGQGAYLDDLRFDGVTHAVFLRSPHAHARITGIDTAAAVTCPGVVAILTAAEATADHLQPLRPTVEANVQTNEPFRFLPQPLLAEDTVRYAGEPVALVVAETRNQALDAAERIVIDYQPLPAITRATEALAPHAPQLATEVPGNLCLDWHWGQTAEVADTIKSASKVVTITVNNHRIATNPMEPRGAVGRYDARYTLHLSSQNIHGNRDMAARALGVDPSDVRFIAPDVGGGFGAKNFAYAEHALILWAARVLPVRPPGARPSRNGHPGPGRGGKFPGLECGQYRQSGRLRGGRVLRRADQPVPPPARHGVQRPDNLVAR
jgi:carbon-monoxide dehydrogenase large subunit